MKKFSKDQSGRIIILNQTENTEDKILLPLKNFFQDFFHNKAYNENFKNFFEIVDINLDDHQVTVFLNDTHLELYFKKYGKIFPINKEEHLFLKKKFLKEDYKVLDSEAQTIILQKIKESDLLFKNSFDELSLENQEKILSEVKKYDILENNIQNLSSFLKKDLVIIVKNSTISSENKPEYKIYSNKISESERLFCQFFLQKIHPEIPKKIILTLINPFPAEYSEQSEFKFSKEPKTMTSHEILKFRKILKINNLKIS